MLPVYFEKSDAEMQDSMREWLSWWSTTLPRSGSRVRVPSRALKENKKDIRERVSFLFSSAVGTQRFEVYAPVVAEQTSLGHFAMSCVLFSGGSDCTHLHPVHKSVDWGANANSCWILSELWVLEGIAGLHKFFQNP